MSFSPSGIVRGRPITMAACATTSSIAGVSMAPGGGNLSWSLTGGPTVAQTNPSSGTFPSSTKALIVAARSITSAKLVSKPSAAKASFRHSRRTSEREVSGWLMRNSSSKAAEVLQAEMDAKGHSS